MIEVKNLSFGYRKKEKLFQNLSLDIKPGKISGLLGKNGVGKTTLLKIICGLLFPQGGECKVLGVDSYRRYPEPLGEIFFIPEEFYLPSITPKEYINAFSPFYNRFDNMKFDEYLRIFEVPSNIKLTSMSYGQKKKFLLAFGLATTCKILLLDEPTNGLDIPSKSQFRKTLASAVTHDRIILISTHQVRDMESLIDSIIIMDDGEIIFHQGMDSILSKLSVKLVSDPSHIEDSIYYEKTLGGYAVLTENRGEEDTKIDLELLFNAIIKNRERFYEIFSEEVLAHEN